MNTRDAALIRANIARQQERHDAALREYQAIRAIGGTTPSRSERELCEEIGRAARRLYQLRRELIRAGESA